MKNPFTGGFTSWIFATVPGATMFSSLHSTIPLCRIHPPSKSAFTSIVSPWDDKTPCIHDKTPSKDVSTLADLARLFSTSHLDTDDDAGRGFRGASLRMGRLLGLPWTGTEMVVPA